MFEVIQSNSGRVPLIFDPAKHPGVTDNRTFLYNHVLTLLTNAFPHLQRYDLILLCRIV